MIQNTNTESMVIDLKKHRIRIRKSTLHALGDPNYIQLLFNPEAFVVAIRCLDEPELEDQETKVDWKKISSSENSFEMYSLPLMNKIAKTTTIIEEGNVYRFSGSIYSRDRVVCFPLYTIQKLE